MKKLIVRKAIVDKEPSLPKLKMPAQGVGTGGTDIGVQKVFQMRVDMTISHGGVYEGESYETVQNEIRDFVKKRWPNANYTPTGGYYLIESVVTGHREVCRPEDFDFDTMTRKPGTRPPSWATDPSMAASIDREYRIIEESLNPNKLAKNPENLFTARELDRKKNKKLNAAKDVSEVAAKEHLDAIAEERPDLIQLPAVKRTVKALPPGTKRLMVKKSG